MLTGMRPACEFVDWEVAVNSFVKVVETDVLWYDGSRWGHQTDQEKSSKDLFVLQATTRYLLSVPVLL